MDSMQRATESRPRGYLPGATWAAIGLLVLAVLLSLSILVLFPWNGTIQQEESAVGPWLVVLLVICGCALVGTVLGVVGLVQARRRGAGVSAISIIVSVLGFMFLIASLLQGAYYLFIFAFIGG